MRRANGNKWVQPGPWLMAAVVVSVGMPAALAQPDKLPSAEEVINKSIEAQGGRAAFEKLKSRKSKGTFEITGQGLKGTVVSYEQAPDKQYNEMVIEGLGTMASGTNGVIHWENNAMMGPRILTGAERKLNERQTRFNGQLHWKALYEKAECVGVEEVLGQSCFKVVFTPNGEGKPETIYYSRKTYLPVQNELTADTAMGSVPVKARPTDYHKVDGVLLPHKITQDVGNGMQVMVITLEKVEHNIEIPGEKFEPPPEVRKLIDADAADGDEM